MADDLAIITKGHWTAVQRVRRLPVPEADKLAALADLGVL
jgi:hypothetical protein